jgi:hypothetical protein
MRKFHSKKCEIQVRKSSTLRLETTGKITWRQQKRCNASVTFRVKNKTPTASCYRVMKASDEEQKGPSQLSIGI